MVMVMVKLIMFEVLVALAFMVPFFPLSNVLEIIKLASHDVFEVWLNLFCPKIMHDHVGSSSMFYVYYVWRC